MAFQRAGYEERQVPGDGPAEAALKAVEAEAGVLAERLVTLVSEAAGVVTAAGLGLDRDDAGLRVAELGRGGAGSHRRLFQRVGADADLGTERTDVAAAAVSRRHRNAVDVGDGFVGTATADGDGVVRGAGNDSRL